MHFNYAIGNYIPRLNNKSVKLTKIPEGTLSWAATTLLLKSSSKPSFSEKCISEDRKLTFQSTDKCKAYSHNRMLYQHFFPFHRSRRTM